MPVTAEALASGAVPLVIDEGTPIPPGFPATPLAPPARRTPPPGAVTDLWGRPVDLGARWVPLPLTTPLEKFLIGTMAVGFFVGFVTLIPPKHSRAGWAPPWQITLPALAVGAVFGFLAWAIDCFYLLDNRRQVLVFRRTFLGLASDTDVCGYGQIAIVTVLSTQKQTKHSSWWEYAVTLVTPREDLITITDWTRDLGTANHFGAALARHLAVDHAPGRPGQVLRLRRDPGTGRVLATHDVPGFFDLPTYRLLILGFMAAAALAIVVAALVPRF